MVDNTFTMFGRIFRSCLAALIVAGCAISLGCESRASPRELTEAAAARMITQVGGRYFRPTDYTDTIRPSWVQNVDNYAIIDVDLQYCHVDDSLLASLSSLEDLRALNLAGVNLSPQHISKLSSLNKLQILTLSNSSISDSDFSCLSALTELRSLRVVGTKITDRSLASVAKLKHLQTFDATGTIVSDQGVRNLLSLPLVSLDLWGTNVSDEGVQSIASITTLEHLGLQETTITDKSVPYLTKLSNIRTLFINKTKVTQHGVNTIRQSRPLCSVEY